MIKIISLQCVWIKKLYDQSFNDRTLKLVDNTFGNNFKFHLNLDFDDSPLHLFPHSYRNIFLQL